MRQSARATAHCQRKGKALHTSYNYRQCAATLPGAAHDEDQLLQQGEGKVALLLLLSPMGGVQADDSSAMVGFHQDVPFEASSGDGPG